MSKLQTIKTLYWLDVLNEQTTWKSRKEFLSWFSEIVGHPPSLSESAISDFEAVLAFMREQLARLHFSQSMDLARLNTLLNKVTVQVVDSRSTKSSGHSRLPSFRATAPGALDADLLRSLQESLLLQFAEVVGAALDNGFDNLPVSRCEGLYKHTAEDAVAEVAAYPTDTEDRWRSEIPLLKDAESRAEDLLRCSDFFLKTPKGRFCSDACRFTTFQIAKQLKDPDYLAEKQRRYRSKQSKSQTSPEKQVK